MNLTYIVKDEQKRTVKQILKEEFEISDRLLLKLKNTQNIFINNTKTPVNTVLQKMDTLQISLDTKEDNSNIVPTNIPLSILYEDDSMLILDKPAGIAVHPSFSHYDTSLSNGVRYYFDTIGLKKKIRPVNRLDKDTSGIVIFAKNEYIQECLAKQMKQHQFKKQYIALVEGKLKQRATKLTFPIARKTSSIIERCVASTGETAITRYYVIREWETMSLLSISLETGKTHQIRVHMAHIGHPIVGDTLYGTESKSISRQALHACKVDFIHPITKQKMSIESPIPNDMEKIIFK